MSNNGKTATQPSMLARLPKESLTAVNEISTEVRRAEIVLSALRNQQTNILRNALGMLGIDPNDDVTVDLETGIVSKREPD